MSFSAVVTALLNDEAEIMRSNIPRAPPMPPSLSDHRF